MSEKLTPEEEEFLRRTYAGLFQMSAEQIALLPPVSDEQARRLLEATLKWNKKWGDGHG